MSTSERKQLSAAGYLVGVTFALLAAAAACAGPQERSAMPYGIYEAPPHTGLTTPSGTKMMVGEFGPKGTSQYRVEVPLADLTPRPTATPDPSQITPTAVPSPTPTSKVTAQQGPEEPTALPPLPTPQPQRSAASVPPFYDDSDSLILRANHLFNRRKYLEAYDYVEELLRRRPDHVRGWVMKGSLMYAQGQKDLARKAWEHALTLEPESPEIKGLLERYR